MPIQLKEDSAKTPRKPGVYVVVSNRHTKESKALTIYDTDREEMVEAIKRLVRTMGKERKASA